MKTLLGLFLGKIYYYLVDNSSGRAGGLCFEATPFIIKKQISKLESQQEK
jgi:hypothetical protein